MIRPSGRASACVTYVVSALLLAQLAACGEERHKTPPSATPRVVVIGFDGLDPALTERWMADGKLPHFAKLRSGGHYQRLGSTNPPQSPVAWSSFATGLDPGAHGVFDFLARAESGYAPELSIAKITPPKSELKAFGYKLPLSDATIVNSRLGSTVWAQYEQIGLPASVLRVPVTFPPEPINRMLSGMGVPDLLGTQGTYTLFTTESRKVGAAGQSEGRVVQIAPQPTGEFFTRIEGPSNPIRQAEIPLHVDLKISSTPRGASLAIGDKSIEIPTGSWSDWVELDFDFPPFQSIRGVVKFHLSQGFPNVRLYMTPIQVDPKKPALPISSPPDYAAKLAGRIGRFHTLGMAEETWSLNEGHLSDDAYLDMVADIYGQRERMLFDTLGQRDSALVVMVFVQPDRVSHMFWRGIDPQHPLHASVNERGRNAIEWAYVEADRILGKAMTSLAADDKLVVLSDHGFAPYRHSVHLNRWLLEHGYLALKNGRSTSGALYQHVDWSRTKAYAQGLNGLFLNVRGRETQGIVSPNEIDTIKRELSAALTTLKNPVSNETVVSRVYDASVAYRGGETKRAPDMVVGYAPGYRASWQTALGGVPATTLEANNQKWSGDHCIDVDQVPGVLFTNFTLPHAVTRIADMSALLLKIAPQSKK